MTNNLQDTNRIEDAYYNGFRVLHDRYPCIFDPDNKYARPNGIVNIHILQAVILLERDLKPEEVVHHVDENKWNYNLENLWVFRSTADHSAFHQGMPVSTTNEGVYYCPSLDSERRCNRCGKLLRKHSRCEDTKLCLDCVFILRRINSNRPERNVLKRLLLHRNFLKIAENFGVTDNAVRKWCKYYNLPHKTSDLKQLTDKEILDL